MLNNERAAETFYAISAEILQQSLDETIILYEMMMGGGVKIYYGIRENRPVWLMKNPRGLNAAWYDEGQQVDRM